MPARLFPLVMLAAAGACVVPDVEYEAFEIACERNSDCPFPQTCSGRTCAVPGADAGGGGEGEGEGAAEGEGEGEGGGEGEGEGPGEGEGEGGSEGEGEGASEGEGEGGSEGEGESCDDCVAGKDCGDGRRCVAPVEGRAGMCRRLCDSQSDCPADHVCRLVAVDASACLPIVGRVSGSWTCEVSDLAAPETCRSGLEVEIFGVDLSFDTHAVSVAESAGRQVVLVQWAVLAGAERWAVAAYVGADALRPGRYAVPLTAGLDVVFYDGETPMSAGAGNGGTVEVTRAGREVGELSAGVIEDVELMNVAVPYSRCTAGEERCVGNGKKVCGPCGLKWEGRGPCGR